MAFRYTAAIYEVQIEKSVHIYLKEIHVTFQSNDDAIVYNAFWNNYAPAFFKVQIEKVVSQWLSYQKQHNVTSHYYMFHTIVRK